MAFPTTVDSFSTPTAGSLANSPSISGTMNSANTAIVALETKVGVDSSAVTSSLDYKLTNTASSNPGHKHTLANGATDVTASADEVNILDGATLSTTELNYVDGVTSAIQTQLNAKAPTASPTFTGTVTLPTGLTGIAKLASGVVSAVTAPSGTIVGTSDSQELTNKTVTSPVINTAISGTAIASGAEVTTGTDDTQIVTPKALGDAGVNTRLKSKVISADRTNSDASGDVAYTGVGFSPTCIIATATVEGISSSDGICDSIETQGCKFIIGGVGYDGGGTLIHGETTLNTAKQVAVLSSFDSDGFTLTWTKTGSPSGTTKCQFLCMR